MAQILSGIVVRDQILKELKSLIEKNDKKPTLVIMQVGDRSDSASYINQKKLFAEKIGTDVVHVQYTNTIAQSELIAEIQKYNADKNVHGIILQIPIPQHLDKEVIINTIDPQKDVDGLTAYNAKLLSEGKNGGIIPATARGVLTLLDYYKIPVSNKHVVVIGRSALVGRPTALALSGRGAIVTVAHRQTNPLSDVTKAADILVVAIGNPEFITDKHVRKDQVVIDIGINIKNGGETSSVKPENEPSKKVIVGDVDFKKVEPLVSAISPVPGGVGPMTVASLFQNLYESFVKIENI